MENNSNDIHQWKELLSSLNELSEENRYILQELQNEIRMQRERNKKEVAMKAREVEEQLASFQNLLQVLQEEDLYSLDVDQKVLAQLKKTIQNQLDKTQSLVSQSQNMLSTETVSTDVLDPGKQRTRRNREKTFSYHPKHFKEDFLLGNWICYHTGTDFTCQSFWKDHTFKEYDFHQSSLKNEREGTFEIDQETLTLHYPDRTETLTIAGFNDEMINYSDGEDTISFQYMPADLLNQFLAQSSIS